MAIVLGMPLLVGFMGLVMGVPFVYYFKRDGKYDATKGQPDNIRLQAWYN